MDQILRGVRRYRNAQAYKLRKTAIQDSDAQDEWVTIYDVIQIGGIDAERSVTAMLSKMMRHGEQIYDSVVEGAPRRLKVDLAERCEEAQRKLDDSENWSA
eukprot:SAG31_NODE_3542_length_4143_cov_2.092977_2_plen_101_part_00